MPTLRLIFFGVYLFYVLTSGAQAEQGSGLDPLGLTNPPPNTDQGSGLDPLG